MKRIFTTALAAMAIALPAVSLTANLCCFNPCEGGPLRCGKFVVAVKGGVTPTSYTDRGQVFIRIPPPGPGVIPTSRVAKFSNQFDLPWNVGAELAWNASCRIQFFLEYAFTGAKGKRYTFESGGIDLIQVFDDYEVHGGYIGSRYFFEGCCFPCLGKIAPYVGFKAGFAEQRRLLFDETINGVNQGAPAPYFLSQTAVSGGLQIGLEWWFRRCLSVALQGEFVGTCGRKPNRNLILDPALSGGVTNTNIGGTGWVIGWPITLSLRWSL